MAWEAARTLTYLGIANDIYEDCGVAENGKAALASMFASCSPGVGIVNIDNGYGAACAAARMINSL